MVYVEDVISADRISSIEHTIKQIYNQSPIVINGATSADEFVTYIFSFIDNDQDADAFLRYVNNTPSIDCYGIINYLLKNH